MSESLLVAIVSVLGVVYTATIGALVPLLASIRKNAKVAADQVANSHDMPLREDLDAKHHDNSSRFGRLEGRVGRVESQVSATSRGVQRIEQHLGIEQTVPRPPQPRRKR